MSSVKAKAGYSNQEARDDLAKLSVDTLKEKAVGLGIKQDGVGWTSCCPPDGSKSAIISSIIQASELQSCTVEGLRRKAIGLGIKQEGVDWKFCCPPDGNKSAIVAAIVRVSGSIPTEQEHPPSNTNQEPSCTEKGQLPQSREDLQASTLKQLQEITIRLGIKKDGVGWSVCCPPLGNKSDVIAAILATQSDAAEPLSSASSSPVSRKQGRVAAGASAERDAHAVYGVEFKGPAPAGAHDLALFDGSTAEVKHINEKSRLFAMAITLEAPYGKELKKQATDSKQFWKDKSTIPAATVRDLVRKLAEEKGTTPTEYAEVIKDWYLQKSSKLVVEIKGECFEIPASAVRVHNNDDNAKAFTSYGAGTQIKIDGEIPEDYRKYSIQDRGGT